jgi:type II secretory pathway pseudopilin PulG
MAGLLGMFDPEVAQGFSVDPEERKRLLIANALLGVSGGLLGARKGQELQGLGYGMLQGAGMGQQAVSEASRDKYNQFRMMSEGQKMVDQRRAQAQAARDAQEVAGAFTGGAPDVSPLANGQGPTVANAAAQLPASPLGDQYRKAAQIYMRQNNPEKAKMAMEMAAKEDEEFSTTPQVGVGPDGPYNYVLGKRGTEKRLSAGVAPKFREVNTGGKVQVVNEYNLPSTGQSFDVTNTPYQDASLGISREQLGVSRGNLAVSQAAERRQAAEAAAKQEAATVKEARGKEAQITKADIVLGKVDEALGDTGFFTTGATGAALGRTPGTKAYNLRSTVETIKANLGFNELQAMRDASPTGGALGQVAVQELQQLQATIANLDPNQSEAQLRSNLERVKGHYEKWRETLGGGKQSGPPQIQGDADYAALPSGAEFIDPKGQRRRKP